MDKEAFGSCRNPESSGACRGGSGRRRGRMLDQGMLRFVVLRHIARQPRHGYDLIKLLQEQSGGVYSPSPGMIYPMLSMLEDLGYVSVEMEGSKRLYSLTEQGQNFLDQNRALATAIEERLSALRNDDAERVRTRLHALRDAVQERMPLQQVDPDIIGRLESILDKALQDIQAL